MRPLVTLGQGKVGGDWTSLSRKHEIETDVERRHISIFGGKLTDCLNVGKEVCAWVRRLSGRVCVHHCCE